MAQLVELKTVKSTDTLPLASTAHNDTPPLHAHDDQKIETPWDAAKRGAKPEVTAFDGSLDPKKYMDWEAGLDEYFDWYQLPKGRRLQFAQMKLTGQVRIYWRNIQVTMEHQQEPIITSWAEMKSRLRDKFVPACYRPMIIDEWQHDRQDDGTVAEYIARFDDLMIRCNLDEEPVVTLARFRIGLRPEYQRELVLQEVSTLEKAYQYTINMELFSSYTQRTHPPWIATTEVTRFVQTNSAVSPPTPLPRANQPSVPSPTSSTTAHARPSHEPSDTPHTCDKQSAGNSCRRPDKKIRNDHSFHERPTTGRANSRGKSPSDFPDEPE